MAILKHFPKKVEVLDRRSKDGGYYEAKCDVCEVIYYPASVRSKYCSNRCSLIAYRKRKKDNPESYQQQKTKKEELLGSFNLSELGDYFLSDRKKSVVMNLGRNLKIGQSKLIIIAECDYTITKISSRKFELR